MGISLEIKTMSAPPPAYDNAAPAAPPSYGATPATESKSGGMSAAYPASYAGNAGEPSMWQSGLCDCFQDMDICLCGWGCGTCVIRRTDAWLEAREFGCMDILVGCGMYVLNSFYGIGLPVTWWCSCQNRKRIKERYNIVDINGQVDLTAKDYLSVICCTPCAACQHAREMSLRGDRPMM